MLRKPRPDPDPATIALQALAFLSEDDERLGRFLSLTGMRRDRIAAAAAARDPSLLIGVLSHVVGWEPLLLQLAAAIALPPEEIVAALDRL